MAFARPTWKRRFGKLTLRLLSVLPRRLRDTLVLNRIRPPPADADVVVKIADTPEEHEQALRLLFKTYLQTGLVESIGVPVRVNPFLILPTTVRFVALVRGEVVGTMSLISDSALGLPLEAAYPEPVAALRATGAKMAEIGALAVRPELRRHGLTMLLYKAMWATAVRLVGATHLVAAVHPDAEVIYTAALRFERLTTDVLRYPGINGDALALCLDLRGAEAKFAQAFKARSPGRFNPYVFFTQTQHRQLQLPASPGELQPLIEAGRRAALRLLWLRPEAVMQLKPREFSLFERALATT